MRKKRGFILPGVLVYSCVPVTNTSKLSENKEFHIEKPKMVVGDKIVVTDWYSDKVGIDTLTIKVICIDKNGDFDVKVNAKKI